MPARHDRPDAYERAFQRAREGAADEPDAPPDLPKLHVGPFRVGSTGLLVGVVALVLVGGLVRIAGDRHPTLTTSCQAYALRLTPANPEPGGIVGWSATGPSGPVVLAVDVARFQAGRPVPMIGGPVQVLPATALRRCTATARFGIQVPTGEHVVGLFRGGLDGGPVAQQAVTVTRPGDPAAGTRH